MFFEEVQIKFERGLSNKMFFLSLGITMFVYVPNIGSQVYMG